MPLTGSCWNWPYLPAHQMRKCCCIDLPGIVHPDNPIFAPPVASGEVFWLHLFHFPETTPVLIYQWAEPCWFFPILQYLLAIFWRNIKFLPVALSSNLQHRFFKEKLYHHSQHKDRDYNDHNAGKRKLFRKRQTMVFIFDFLQHILYPLISFVFDFSGIIIYTKS